MLYNVRVQITLGIDIRVKLVASRRVDGLRMTSGDLLVAGELLKNNEGINTSRSGTHNGLNKAEEYYTTGGNC
jgi:hypothetical protein